MTSLITASIAEMVNLFEQVRPLKSEWGKDLSKFMYKSNEVMINESIEALRLQPKHRVLEIGPGNGAHLENLLSKAKQLRYFGLDISQTMVDEAIKNNSAYIDQRKALFCCYNGEKIEYVHHWFDRIITINTIYFWNKPLNFLNELYRVLKPKGLCIITFIDGEFMKNLPFVNDTIQLYSTKKIKELVVQTRFELVYFQQKNEKVKSKSDEMVSRSFIITILKKEPKISSSTFE